MMVKRIVLRLYFTYKIEQIKNSKFIFNDCTFQFIKNSSNKF